MAWFLALQGPSQSSQQSSVYELQDGTDVDKLAQELVSAVTLDRVVPIPATLPRNNRKRQKVTLYIRPAAWALWTFYELTDDDRQSLMKDNPLMAALQKHQREHTGPGGGGQPQANPLLGQQGPGGFRM